MMGEHWAWTALGQADEHRAQGFSPLAVVC